MKLSDAIKIRLSHALCGALTISLIAASCLAQPAPATSQPSSEDRIALYQALLDLTNPWTVMCVAAHPDDEDGTSLIVMRRKYGAHTVSLFSTFGEGGQNAIGPELYEELGAIRARETMAASEVQGSEPYFLGLRDFGFSKSRDETFQKWGQEEALRRMVLQIRKLRPDVIITNHSRTSNDHGHHQATARLVVDAFDAAADPAKFPEQLKDGVTTWQVQRLFVRVRGSQAPPADAQLVTIDPNERDPVRGTVFAEQALSALQKHATQGPWPKTFAEFTARFRAFTGQSGAAGQMPLIRYRLEREAKGADGMPSGSYNFLEGLVLKDESRHRLAPLIMSNNPLLTRDNTHALLSDKDLFQKLGMLAKVHRLTPSKITIPAPRVNAREELMEARLNVALSEAAGLKLEVGSEVPPLVAGSPAKFTITVSNNGSREARLYGVAVHVGGGGEMRGLGTRLLDPGQTTTIDRAFEAHQTGISVPHSKHLYDEKVFGEKITVFVDAKIEGISFRVVWRTTIDVAPPVEITHATGNFLVMRRDLAQNDRRELGLTVQLVNHRDADFSGELRVQTNNGDERLPVNLAPLGRESMRITAEQLLAKFDIRRANTINWINLALLSGRSQIAMERIPFILVDARVTPTLRVGYIRGFDFSLPNALNALGVESKELSVDEVKTSDLSKYTSIIVDNRVYQSKPELIGANQKLLDYANAGGNLIVFYHQTDEFNPNAQRNRPQLAPYKLILGNERITDENAPITFLEPNHSLLNSPNKLNQDDFKDWIQERGLYYPREWDPQFKALLQSNDPGEAPLKGGLLVADYGKGHYIYTSMVWYRQLRAGVPGAYRMLANMISYGRN